MSYTNTSLWQATLAEKKDIHELKRKELRESYERARDNISGFLDKIREDFDFLTLHDISHVDSLWKTASVIIGDDYEVTPMEGYVLGCAFLIHDAALCYEAYGGVDSLREEVVWRDCFADIKSNSNNTIEQQQKDADFWAIRLLHAKKGKEILDINFKGHNDRSYYIIEDENLRNHLKELIGDIAYSHHWDITKISKLLDQENPIAEFPLEWSINPRKLACIIRCADAAHLDSGRAPDYLFHILKLNGVSYDHWKAQNYLSQIGCCKKDKNKVIITSTKKFKEDDFAAWNVVFDAVTVLNNEIKASNRLLESIGEPCFQVQEVAGAYSRSELNQYIRTEGWTPCEANIHISNVANLISNLGGSRLYGKDDQLVIVIRELIQNARDAIKAREQHDEDFKNGEINIKVIKENGNTCITVSDNGIGMSLQTITNYLLNFGTSFWQSDLAKKEFPGLRSSKFQSVGKFGIGFYSVFMVSQQVYVESRKYDDAQENTIQLKFPNGLTLSPIVSKKRGSTNCSTRVTFNTDFFSELYTIEINVQGESNFQVPFHKVISALCAGLDVDVYYQDDTTSRIRVHQNIEDLNLDRCQWLKDISYAEYQKNNISLLEYIDNNYKRLEHIKENGRIVGLAAMHIESLIFGSKFNFLSNRTIGGLCSSIHSKEGSKFIGFMDHYGDTAKRDSSSLSKATDNTIHKWAKSQYSKLGTLKVYSNINLSLPYFLYTYQIDPIDNIIILVRDNNGTRYPIILDHITRLLDNGYRLIFLKDSSSGNGIEINYDKDKTLAKLEQKDLFFIWEYRGEFNTLEMIEGKPKDDNSLLGCLWRKASLNNCIINSFEIHDFVESKYGGMCTALVIEAKGK